MASFVNTNAINIQILKSIEKLIELRNASEKYIIEPNNENSDLIISLIDEIELLPEEIKISIVTLIKQSNGIIDEVVGKQTDNGIILS